MEADAGGPPQAISVAFGPTRLHFALAMTMKAFTIFLGMVVGVVSGLLCRKLVCHIIWPGITGEPGGWPSFLLPVVTTAFAIAGGFLGRSAYERVSKSR